MTNKERYQKAFGQLHASRASMLEVYDMNNKKHTFHLTRAVAAVACLVALLTTTAFAADAATGGALSDQLKLVVNGIVYHLVDDHTDEDGTHTMTYVGEDSNGEYNVGVSVVAEDEDNISYEIDTNNLPEGTDSASISIAEDKDGQVTITEDYTTESETPAE